LCGFSRKEGKKAERKGGREKRKSFALLILKKEGKKRQKEGRRERNGRQRKEKPRRLF
jgi:hypothetical protein